jgi:catechol 2,3-dioxygenase-like lactoylglutathione lyase family enzyme
MHIVLPLGLSASVATDTIDNECQGSNNDLDCVFPHGAFWLSGHALREHSTGEYIRLCRILAGLQGEVVMRMRRGGSAAVFSVIMAILLSGGIAAAQQPASMDETITFFYYEDLAAQVPFYEGLLGLEKTMDEDWVKIYRITATSSVGLVQQGRGFHEVSADKPAMLSIVTDDVDAWYERLAVANVRVRSELAAPGSDKEPGSAPVRSFIVEDPGGYTIEFFTWQRPRPPLDSAD